MGFKKSYSSERPWLFEDFDQITFYEISEDEYEAMMAVFRSGRYEYEYEDTEFDMKEHNKLLRDTKDEVAQIRAKQRKAQAEMDKTEKDLLEKWNKEKEEGKISMDTVEELMNGLSTPTSSTTERLTKLTYHRSGYHPGRSTVERQRLESGSQGR